MALEAGHHHGGAGANYLDMHAAPELDSTGMFVSGAPSDEVCLSGFCLSLFYRNRARFLTSITHVRESHRQP